MNPYEKKPTEVQYMETTDQAEAGLPPTRRLKLSAEGKQEIPRRRRAGETGRKLALEYGIDPTYVSLLRKMLGKPSRSRGRWSVMTTGRYAIKVIRALYSNCGVALGRKREAAEMLLARCNERGRLPKG